jgi:DNA primase
MDLAALYLELMGVWVAPADNELLPVAIPKDSIFIKDWPDSLTDFVLQKFNIEYTDAHKGRLAYCQSGEFCDRIIFPSFDRDGKLNYFTSRALSDNVWAKYINCGRSQKDIIFNELYVDWSRDVILTESVKTHIKMFDFANYIPILGTKIQKKSKFINEFILNGNNNVILMFDRNAIHEQNQAAKILLKFGFNVKIVNDMAVEQPDQLTCEQIEQLVKNATLLDFNLLIRQKIRENL